MVLDLFSLLIFRVGVELLIGAGFWALHRRYPAIGGPGWWALGMMLGTVGTMGILWRQTGADLMVAMSTAVVLEAGVFCVWLGLRSYLRLHLPLRSLALGLLALTGAHLLLAWISAPLVLHQATFALAALVISVLSVRDLLRCEWRQHPEYLALMLVTLVEFAVLAAFVALSLLGLAGALPPRPAIPGVGSGFVLFFLFTKMARAILYATLVALRLRLDAEQAGRQLATSEFESRNLLKNLSAAVMVFKPDETLVSANAEAKRFLGWPEKRDGAEYLESIPRFRLLRDDGQLLPHDEIPLNRVLAAGEPVNGMVLGVQSRHRPDVRWALCNGYPQKDAGGELQHVVLSFLDITSLRQAEAERKQLQAQLTQSQKMESLGTLAGGVAHDFNNILAAILGNADLARQDIPATHPALQSLHEVSTAARRGRELVRQILAFSRQQPMQRTCVSVDAMVDDSCRLLRTALPSGVKLVHRRDTTVPHILADASQLGQVLLNLGTNAVHALEGRAGTVRYQVDTLAADDARLPVDIVRRCGGQGVPAVCVTVADDGVGMSEETQQRMFEPFFTTKGVGKGTGLGLPVVLGIVEAHGGVIEVDSAPGEGTAFHLFFASTAQDGSGNRADQHAPQSPQSYESGTMVQAPAEQAGVSAARPVPATPEAHHMTDESTQAPLHIMYLDDDDTLVFLVRRLLERRGYKVSAFADQDEAIDAVRNDPEGFDLLLTDYNMPGMSGLDVAKAVLAINPALPVAVASGYITDELQAEAMAAGVREVVFKTDAVETFCDVVARLATPPAG